MNLRTGGKYAARDQNPELWQRQLLFAWSIGIVTGEGELFCGDLMDNMGRPRLEFFIDDLAAARSSIEKLRDLKITAVYPGHGKSFLLSRFLEKERL